MSIKLNRRRKMAYKADEAKVRIYFDRTMLNLFVGYVFTESKHITKSNLINLNKLCDIIDLGIYEKNIELYSRIKFIQSVLEAKLKKGLEHYEIIINYCRKDNEPEYEKIIDEIEEYKNLLNYNEIKFINKAVIDRLKYAYIMYYKDMIQDTFMRLDTNDYKTFQEINDEIKAEISWLMNDIRKTESITSMDTFSLSDEIMDSFIANIIEKEQNPGNLLKTGIKALNTMLCGGFMPGRLYLWLGTSGGGKSNMLLHCARWIKLYNVVEPKRKDIGTVPTVLLITTENSVSESVLRLFNMCVTDESIANFKPKDAIKMLKETGKMILETGGTDIVIKYYANYEIATDDLYGIIEDLEDENREIIALIFDYIKRIRSANPSNDERIQLKNASNELKDLAVRLDIPVITAQQINRAGNVVVEEAIRAGKVDVARNLGATDVALAWDLIENSDWVGIINQTKTMSGDNYLTIKNPKCRMKRLSDITYINHPFAHGSTIRLIDDINMDQSLSIESLASNLDCAGKVSKKGTRNAVKREFEDEDDDESLVDFTKYIKGK